MRVPRSSSAEACEPSTIASATAPTIQRLAMPRSLVGDGRRRKDRRVPATVRALFAPVRAPKLVSPGRLRGECTMRSYSRSAPWLVALVLAMPAAARADDACLTGDSTLGDQRAMAAIHTALDGTCSCESFATRGAYRLCGKNVISQAVTGATLR